MAYCASRRAGQTDNRLLRRYDTCDLCIQGRILTLLEILKAPLSRVQPLTRTAPEPPPPGPAPKTQKEETIEKARIIFGSKLAGPTARMEKIKAESRNISGVMVPPKPEEPENCCMSGCVNCVWDLYRDDMEEWAEKSALARAAIQAKREIGKGTGTMVAGSNQPSHVAVSMDDDGGGSETNWALEPGKANLFDDIPVGIREFMRTEKKLKQIHQRDQAAATVSNSP